MTTQRPRCLDVNAKGLEAESNFRLSRPICLVAFAK